MDNINKLLVVIDPDADRDGVINRAKLIASKCQSTVTLFINSSKPPSQRMSLYQGVNKDFVAQQRKIFVTENLQMLSAIKIEFEELEIDVTMDFREGPHLAESIINKASELGADLTMKSTHHHAEMKRSLMTNTDWRLIRKCPTPLLLVKSGEWKDNGSILAAVDPFHVKSEQNTLDHIMLSTIEYLGVQLEQKPRVFHCYLPFMGSMFPSAEEFAIHLKEIRKQHHDKLLELLSTHEIPPQNIKLVRGELVPSLLKFANETDANLLVIGALSRNFIERAIVGNTAEKILDDIPCDVLIVKRPR